MATQQQLAAIQKSLSALTAKTAALTQRIATEGITTKTGQVLVPPTAPPPAPPPPPPTISIIKPSAIGTIIKPSYVPQQIYGTTIPAAPTLTTTYTGPSIVDYLKSIGQPSDFASRQRLATRYGIANYTGTAEQNIRLLNLLRTGVPPPPPQAPPSPTVTKIYKPTEELPPEIAGPIEAQIKAIRAQIPAIRAGVEELTGVGVPLPEIPYDQIKPDDKSVTNIEAEAGATSD